jgi:lipopolysaccharide export system ATP-binding protein
MGHKLVARDLHKAYKGRKVVDGVTFEVAPGEVVGLLGPNGAGKTTSFYMVVGLVRPDKGEVLLNGEDLTDMPMYQRARCGIAYLPQEASVFRKLTVEENLLAILETGNLSSALRRERARDVNPTFILLDEPFAGIDPLAVIDIQNIISKLQEQGIGILVSDHNVRETLNVCDKAYILNAGEILACGLPKEIAACPKVRSIYLGDKFRL